MVLVLGQRSGIAKSLEKMNISYVVWTNKQIKNPRNAKLVIEAEFPCVMEDLNQHIPKEYKITHVIAGVEDAVIPASKIRMWLELKRNPHSLILKCTDKLKMKKFLSSNDIAMSDFSSGKDLTAKQIAERFGFPVVCKLRLSSGGRGVEFVNSVAEIKQFMNSKYYFEKMIKGKEGSIESLIINNKVIFSNITEYYINGCCNKIPATYNDEIKDGINRLNESVISNLKIKWGITHLEYYLTDKGILFGEVALRPPGGYLMDIMGIAYGEDIWEKFVSIELGFDDIHIGPLQKYTSAIVIHPGEGKIKSIQGLDNIQSLASIEKLKINLKEGQIIPKREGVGQEYGHVILASDNSDQLNEDVDKFFQYFEVGKAT